MEATKIAGRLAASNAMMVMGYVIVSEEGWIVKKFASGRPLKSKRSQVKGALKNILWTNSL